MKKIIKKLRSRGGETIVETLVAVLVVSMGMLLLAGAIVTAARVNRKAAEDNIQVFVNEAATDPAPSITDGQVTVKLDGSDSATYDVKLHSSSGEGADHGKALYYYE